MLSRLSDQILGWFGRRFRADQTDPVRVRGPQTHVVILDGTMSSLEPGYESHAGALFHLARDCGPDVSVYYEAGLQWASWRTTADIAMGRGLNRQIMRAYGWLASRYRPGDKVFLMGYSRGAFAVRSLGGVIDRVGLLTAEHATERNILTAYRHYRIDPGSEYANAFADAFCHPDMTIEMLGVWDTVKALGLRLPLLWRFTEDDHRFHNPHPGASVRNAFHALAIDETRLAYAPVLWRGAVEGQRLEQVWFRGTHGDVGGQLGGFEPARPLANISLVWMLERAESCGLPLPQGWRDRFPCDPDAPSVGTWRGWGKLFLARRRRQMGFDASERLHETAHFRRGRPSFS
jgi:uncharacterized protein (DUF2235 family)